MIIPRKIYLDRLVSRMNNGLIKVITGIRRCGKSFLLFNLFVEYLLKLKVSPKNIIRISLDDEDFIDLYKETNKKQKRHLLYPY